MSGSTGTLQDRQAHARRSNGLVSRLKTLPTPSIKRESRAYFAALGARITQLRKAREMTQAELARALGVSQQTVFAYELGDRRVTVPLLVKLARTFAISLEELTGMSPVRERKGRLSAKAARHAERLQALSKTSQRFVIRIIDVLEALGKHTGRAR